ncbi:hypothetical protein OIU79_030485 [Salix purpurea]|uniref:NB-ARC domain-containing protein n=1 Tax=Salix purpurea TaxID=77065 RepID=A0A9Q0VAS0_SALPP|nr:hypothetical protein OIU79_030485 [Salix purpurea]
MEKKAGLELIVKLLALRRETRLGTKHLTPKIPGRNEYVEKIENILLNLRYKAVGICGMGGTGKTKLARDIFDSEKVNRRFSKRIWLCLSNIQRNDRDSERKDS